MLSLQTIGGERQPALPIAGVVWPQIFGDPGVDCDVELFEKVYAMVSAGLYVGSRFAALLERMALRLEAAQEFAHLADGALAVRCYLEVVSSMEKVMGLVGPPVREEVEELWALGVWYGRAVVPPLGVVTRTSVVSSMTYMPVASGHIAVAVPYSHGKPAPDDSQYVVTRAIYHSVLTVGMRDGSSVKVGARDRGDGVLSVYRSDDPGEMVALSALPVGQYELPGGAGMIVPREVVVRLFEAVWVSAHRVMEEGYCYLRTVPVMNRDAVARVLGPYPRLSALVAVCPSVYTWCDRVAEVDVVVDGVSSAGRYHVTSFGVLPVGLPEDCVLGGEVGSPPGHLDGVFKAFERRVTSATASRSGSSVASAPNMAYRPREHSHVRSASEALVPARVATPVFTLTPGSMRAAGPVWVECDNPREREWANRLAHGPPLGYGAMKELASSRPDSLPDPPVSGGGRVVIVPSVQVTSGRSVSWQARTSPISGWSMERMGRGAGGTVTAAPPYAGALCRYEISTNAPFKFNGLDLPERRTTVWVIGNAVIAGLTRSSGVWRAWHTGGAAALGVEYMSLHMAYQCPAIVPARYDKTAVVCARLVSEDVERGESLYRVNVSVVPGEARLNVYVSDTDDSEAVLCCFTSPGLAFVSYCSVTMTAHMGSVMCVADLAALQFHYCISHEAHAHSADRVMQVEVRRTRGHGGARAKLRPARLQLEGA